MRHIVEVVVALRQRARLLSSSAGAEYTRIHEAEERLTELTEQMNGLADEAVEVMREFSDGRVVIESGFRPAVETITLMTQILKHVMDLADTVEKLVESQRTTGQGLVKAVGQAAQGSACIVSQVAALARALKTVLPGAAGQTSVEAELDSLTAQLHEVLADFRNRWEQRSTGGSPSVGCSLLSKSSFVN
ncbi:MAG: hypothetical protein ACLQVL_31390 [Terriglobia bacterium]